jgi:CheY-like chemotaxis protein
MSDHAPVLVAEDDPNDVFLLRRAFQKAGVFNSVVIAHNGQEAIDYLRGHGPYRNRSNHPFPSLMLLDLKMPLVDGFDVLAWLNSHPLDRQLPIVVLSSSNQEKDIQRAQQMGAHEYRVKPQQFEDLVEIVKEVRSRWLGPDLKNKSAADRRGGQQ